jgi:hypothetical protein
MPIQLDEQNGGKTLVVHVSGKLAKADYEHFVPEFERLVRQHGKLRVLFDMTGFHGWEAGALWDDIKFDVKHFADIERLAMIGEKKWQHGMATFCKPFTKATSDTLTTRKLPMPGCGWTRSRSRECREAMSEMQHSEHQHGDPNGGGVHPRTSLLDTGAS